MPVISVMFQLQLSLSSAFLVPQLTLDLIALGPLSELEFGIYFSDCGCVVQEPHVGQIIGIGCRVRW